MDEKRAQRKKTDRAHAALRAPISWGELIDKITILEIKAVEIASEAALVNVRKELALLNRLAGRELAGDDAEFIALARSVYKRNDERSSIKRRINTLMASDIVEEKSYRSY